MHSVYIKQSIHTKLHRYSADGDTSTTTILCRAHAGATGRYVPGTCGRIGSTYYATRRICGFARILRYNYVHRTCYDAHLSECRKSLFINTYGSNIKKSQPDNGRQLVDSLHHSNFRCVQWHAHEGVDVYESTRSHQITYRKYVHTCACIHMYICVDCMTVRVVLMRCVLLNSC